MAIGTVIRVGLRKARAERWAKLAFPGVLYCVCTGRRKLVANSGNIGLSLAGNKPLARLNIVCCFVSPTA